LALSMNDMDDPFCSKWGRSGLRLPAVCPGVNLRTVGG